MRNRSFSNYLQKSASIQPLTLVPDLILYIPLQIERVTYSRGVQTLDLPADDDEASTERDQESNQAGRETEEELRKRLEAEFEVEKERLEKQIQELVEEEKKRSRKPQVKGEFSGTLLVPFRLLNKFYFGNRVDGRGEA